ncbi:hypothetical protein B7463_g4372, partial [Scytalidium lignicola]
MPTRTLLDRLEKLCNVDVDDVNLELIKKTSNQFAITEELAKPENQSLLDSLVQKYGQEGWEKVYDMTAVSLCARNLPYLSGRVLLQVSPRHIHDRDAITKHANTFAEAFEQYGVSRDRFAIKIPFSGSGASAALQLNAEGIRTLATTVFSLEQAIAAKIAAHLDPYLRPKGEDPALEHPMSARIIHILETFAKAYKETGKEQPIMIIASHFNTTEIFAMTELGCQHVTVQAHNLKTLMETPDSLPRVSSKKSEHPYADLVTPERLKSLSTLDPLARPDWDGVLASMNTDYVAKGGAKLDQFIKEDPLVSKRLNDAMEFFLESENKAKLLIEEKLRTKGFI